jgi:hypothetical protein
VYSCRRRRRCCTATQVLLAADLKCLHEADDNGSIRDYVGAMNRDAALAADLGLGRSNVVMSVAG